MGIVGISPPPLDFKVFHLACRKVVKDDNENVILTTFLSAFISVEINSFYYIIARHWQKAKIEDLLELDYKLRTFWLMFQKIVFEKRTPIYLKFMFSLVA